MTEYVFFLILLLFSCYYLSFLWTILRGLQKTSRPSNQDTPFVSVIVAARNEEHGILRCLQSLSHQSYPSDSYEVVVIDDHSTDGTFPLATSHAQSIHGARIRAISLHDAGSGEGKPAAIAHGVDVSTGSVVLCTDADCSVPPDWIRSMVGCFEPSVVFVAGPVFEVPHASLFSRLQSIEFLGIITASAGLIGNGTPIICNGANIAYRKDAFRRVSGYGSPDSSCDDETLMQRMIRRGIGQVVFNADPGANVLTSTPRGFREFWSQRTRWAAKRGRYEDGRILLRLLGLFGFFVSVLVTLLVSLGFPNLSLAVLGVLVVKALAEFIVLRAGANLFSRQFELSQFVIAELFHVPYIAIAASVGQIRDMRWKGRTFDR